MNIDPEVVIERQPSGYWKATVRIIGKQDGVFAAGNFHNQQDARDWAKTQIDFLKADCDA